MCSKLEDRLFVKSLKLRHRWLKWKKNIRPVSLTPLFLDKKEMTHLPLVAQWQSQGENPGTLAPTLGLSSSYSSHYCP